MRIRHAAELGKEGLDYDWVLGIANTHKHPFINSDQGCCRDPPDVDDELCSGNRVSSRRTTNAMSSCCIRNSRVP
jgi:hypothetical protein